MKYADITPMQMDYLLIVSTPFVQYCVRQTCV